MQNSGHINFNPNPASNPNAIGNNWTHLREQQKKDSNNDTVDTISNEEKLDNLVSSSNQFTFKIQTHLPMDLFPNELLVDIHKVSLITKTMLSKNALSIPINDINRIEVSNDFLFASMEIENGSQTTVFSIKWLRKKEAREAQAIIQGLVVAYKNDIDIAEFNPGEILERLKSLGTPTS